ncbi:MAG: YkgJ family cysteine cluster protein [Myxococcales bacterium]|nr:YkgJ family cysteine cluster protein [Myxococcales bacterium]
MIRQRASDEYCVHNDPETHHCTVHSARPRVCRTYHCRDDKRGSGSTTSSRSGPVRTTSPRPSRST